MSLIRQANRSSRIRAAVIGTTMLTALSGTVLATPILYGPAPITDTHTEIPKFRVTADPRPGQLKASADAIVSTGSWRSAAKLMQWSASNRIVDRLRELQALRGSRGPTGEESKASKEVAPEEDSLNLSVYGEYSYLTSNDQRQLDTDSITNSGSGGIDLTLGDTLIGLIYYYSHVSMASNFLKSNTSSDSNFISLYVAQPIQPWLSVGLTGGYGHTDVEVNLRRQGLRRPTRQSSDSDAWTASPFVSFAYATGDLYASLTTTYQYLHTDTDDSGQLNVQVATGYKFVDWLTGEINGKFSQMLHNTRSGEPEDDNWFGVGGKLKQHITPQLAVYEAYQFNFNESFEEHMFTGGLTYSF